MTREMLDPSGVDVFLYIFYIPFEITRDMIKKLQFKNTTFSE